MPAPTIKPGATIVFVGDSITAGTPPPNGWWTPAVAQISTTLAKPYAASATGGRASATGGAQATVTPTPQFSYINSGVGGNKVADIAAAVPARITQYTPTLVVIEVGVNDATVATPLAAFRASYDSILSQVLAALPSCEIVGMSIFVWHEQWVTSGGSPAWDNAFDPPPPFTYTPSIAEYNAQIQASLTAAGGTFVETRNETLAYEAAHNTPEPGNPVGPLTIDGLHPNSLGQQLMSTQFLGQVSVVP